jgi:glycosyltransferase involved in cell wall biosynthesis
MKKGRFKKAVTSEKAGRLTKAVSRAGWLFESMAWQIRAPFCRKLMSGRPPLDLSIGVTTYKDRFDSCLKPLIKKLSILFPNEQIIVVANGHYLTNEQKEFIKKFDAFCAGFSNVEVESYTDPQGLSFLWNRLIKRAASDNILMLNDDIMIKYGFRRFIEESGIVSAPMATINASWSHFKISKSVIEKVGLFDEGFTEIGGEDDDYLARMAMAGLQAKDLATGMLASRSKRRIKAPRLNSYGRDMSGEAGGYSTQNTEYLLSKWETSDEQTGGAVEVAGRRRRYWRLRRSDDEKD